MANIKDIANLGLGLCLCCHVIRPPFLCARVFKAHNLLQPLMSDPSDFVRWVVAFIFLIQQKAIHSEHVCVCIHYVITVWCKIQCVSVQYEYS